MTIDELMDLKLLLEKAASSHGHLCGGMPLGIRMSIAGLREINMIDPAKRRDLIVFTEIDRCITDAISLVTGCTIGRRNLKLADYGKFAATFVNIPNGEAVRVSSRTGAREAAIRYALDKEETQPSEQIQEFSDREKELIIKGYTEMPEEELISIREVKVRIPDAELPSRPTHIVACAHCGEEIFDEKETVAEGRILCVSCASGAYYENQTTADAIHETARRT